LVGLIGMGASCHMGLDRGSYYDLRQQATGTAIAVLFFWDALGRKCHGRCGVALTDGAGLALVVAINKNFRGKQL